jgi:glutamate synthase domain-containing protein 2
VKLLVLPFTRRHALYALALLATVVLLVLTVAVTTDFVPVTVIAFALSVLGTHDLFQVHHSILRSYPIVAHPRFLLTDMRPEIRQYFLESDTDGVPFDRNTRSIVYQRAKGELDKRPLGTELNVYAASFGSGYFGCRTSEGRFSPEQCALQAADPQVKMVEIKLSQGAKPGMAASSRARKSRLRSRSRAACPGASIASRQRGIRSSRRRSDCRNSLAGRIASRQRRSHQRSRSA